MTTFATIAAAMAAALHVYIFYIESVVFMSKGRRIFGVSASDAEVVRPWAYNQGFYNLFLALGTAWGAIRSFAGHPDGVVWMVFGLLAMLGAALVLALSDRSKLRAALIQGTLPALGLVLLTLAHR